MKIIHKDNIKNFSLPLPVFTSVHIADAIGKDGAEFSIFIGMEKKYVEQLRLLSLDEQDTDLQTNTRDRVRFGEGSYEEWYEKNRTPFILIHKQSDALAALVWFGPEELVVNEDNWHTVAWRSYPIFRGKGLMKNFIQFAMDIYIKKVPDIKIWAVLKRENVGSAKLAANLGFYLSEEYSDDIVLVMIRKNGVNP